jgi:hypothetical protein
MWFWFKGSGIRSQGSGVRIWDLGLRVWGLGFRVQSFIRLRVLYVGFWPSGFRVYRVTY